MKIFLYLLIFIIIGCNINVKEASKSQEATLSIINKKDFNISSQKHYGNREKYHTNLDTIFIFSIANRILKYSKNDFNAIIDNFPELYNDLPNDPKTTYFSGSIWKDITDSLSNKNTISFGRSL